MDGKIVREQMKTLHCCVIIPTYNNQKTLKRVLDGVLEFTQDIILINDGSTEETLTVLKEYPQIQQLHIPKNKGKGNALKTGFKHAVSMGFEFAITIDSDGQHFASDIPTFIKKIAETKNKNILIIGDRNMNTANVLARSAKGNRVSGYWVRLVTGLHLNDSQSGFRLYPIKAMQGIHYLKSTRKFEFETEAIVRAHWEDIKIVHVPINVLYDMSERVSHFRPFKDISRIVVLITWFFLVKFFYIIPRNFLRKLKKKGIKRFFIEDFLQNGDAPKKKALSIALGVFIGLSPLWGFHTIIVIFFAVLLKLNKVIAFAFSNISLTPFIPVVLFLSLKTGTYITGTGMDVYEMQHFQLSDIPRYLETYMIGSLVLSSASSLIFGFLGYVFLSIISSKKN